MKTSFSHIGLAKLCGWFGMTRQAYYQNSWKAIDTTLEEELIIQEVKQIRQIHHSLKHIKTKKLWKSYYRKKQELVNQLQD